MDGDSRTQQTSKLGWCGHTKQLVHAVRVPMPCWRLNVEVRKAQLTTSPWLSSLVDWVRKTEVNEMVSGGTRGHLTGTRERLVGRHQSVYT